MQIFTYCADLSPLGRFSPSMLDDQTRMELLASGYEAYYDDQPFRTDDGEFPDKCTWTGVICDEERNVTEISWVAAVWAHGTVSLDHLPPKLKVFESLVGYSEFSMSGTLNTALLPPDMTDFSVPEHSFTGTLDLTSLPAHLKKFDVSGNRFSGEIDLTRLPATLCQLFLSRNQLTGSINLENLPPLLEYLDLDANAFVGSVCLDSLPRPLKWLDISFNRLSGRLCITNLRDRLEQISFERNNFENVVWKDRDGTKVCIIDGEEVDVSYD